SARGALGVALNETLALVSISIACAVSRLFAPPHVLVGFFIGKNSRETMARSLLQPTVCIAPARVRGCGGWCRTSSFRRVFELGQAFLAAFRRERPHADVDHLGEVGGFRRREIAQVS